MIKLERTSVMNFENALRGARNPLSSWAKSDSFYGENGEFMIGEIDLSLAHRPCGVRIRSQKIPPSGVCVGGYYGADLLVEGV